MRIYFSFILCLFLLPIKSFAQEAVFDDATYTQLISQLTVLQQQANYLEQSLNAIKTLDNSQYKWSNVSDLVNQLGGVVDKANGLSYNAQNMESQFQKSFPGYQAPQDGNQQYQQNLDKTIDTLKGALQTMNVSAQDFTNEPKRMEFLQSQVQSAKGQTQVLQASAQISTELVSQLQLLRQMTMTQANAQNVYYAQQVQAKASDEAGFNQMLKNSHATLEP